MASLTIAHTDSESTLIGFIITNKISLSAPFNSVIVSLFDHCFQVRISLNTFIRTTVCSCKLDRKQQKTSLFQCLKEEHTFTLENVTVPSREKQSQKVSDNIA